MKQSTYRLSCHNICSRFKYQLNLFFSVNYSGREQRWRNSCFDSIQRTTFILKSSIKLRPHQELTQADRRSTNDVCDSRMNLHFNNRLEISTLNNRLSNSTVEPMMGQTCIATYIHIMLQFMNLFILNFDLIVSGSIRNVYQITFTYIICRKNNVIIFYCIFYFYSKYII